LLVWNTELCEKKRSMQNFAFDHLAYNPPGII
jgi:hypothetical protein